VNTNIKGFPSILCIILIKGFDLVWEQHILLICCDEQVMAMIMTCCLFVILNVKSSAGFEFYLQNLNLENFGCVESSEMRGRFFVSSSALTTESIKANGTTCEMVKDNLAQLASLAVNCETRKWIYDCAIENGRRYFLLLIYYWKLLYYKKS
jgi:hypothetical protein